VDAFRHEVPESVLAGSSQGTTARIGFPAQFLSSCSADWRFQRCFYGVFADIYSINDDPAL
jgi:hypothetical protein